MKRILKIIALCALCTLVALSLFACAGTPQDPDDGKGEEASAIRMIPKMNIDMIDGKIEIPYELTEGDGRFLVFGIVEHCGGNAARGVIPHRKGHYDDRGESGAVACGM